MESMLHKIFHINQAGDIVQTYPFLPGKELWFGSYKDADIVVKSSRVAAHHLKIVTSGLKVIAEPQEECDCFINNSLIKKETELQTDDIISIGGSHFMFTHSDSENVAAVVKMILEKDTNTRETTSIPDEDIELMDAHIHNLSFEDVKGFIGEVQELLSQVADGTLPNWRHDVKSKISSDNGGVRSHQLARYVYYGDFNEEFLDEMTQYLNRVFNRKDGYNNLVLLPTLLRWIVIASYEMDGRMANYYLENGGSKKVESLTKEFVYKMKKKKAKRLIQEISQSDDENDYIPSSLSPASLEKDENEKLNVKEIDKDKKPCPLCGNYLSNLPRHMRSHGWDKKKASKVVTNHDLRKPYQWHGEAPKRSKNAQPQKDYHVKKRCPLSGCWYVGVKVGRHLQSKAHKMDPTDDEYKEALKDARRFDESDLPETTVRHSVPNKDSGLNEDTEQVHQTNQSNVESNTTEQTLKLFLDFMLSPDGGKCDPKSSLQAVQEVRTAINHLDGDVLNLFDRKKVRDDFFRDHLDKTCKAATSKHYISSLIKFMEFLISDEIDIPPCTHDDFMSLKLRLYSWRKSYNKQVDEQRWCHYEDDMEALITPEQVSTFESGELARTAIKLFGKVSVEDNFNPSMLEYTNMRDYLITTIALANAHRSGVSANMVIGEYEKHQSSGENVIIRVRNHKTFRKHGFAHVCIPSHTFQLLKLFVEKVRSCIQASCDNIFVTWKGKPLNSGAVSKQINSTWKRSGVYGDKPPPKKNICANVIRRSVTSLVHDQQLEKALPVADLLAHSLTTAGKHYRRREMEKQASVGSKVIHDVLHFKKRELSSESSTLRRAWSEDELSTMKELFKDSLEAGDILLETVREKASSLNFKGRTEKQVYDKLRSIIREDKGKTQLIPPAKNEKIVAKVTRYLSSNDPDHSEADNKEDDTDSLSVMSSSTTTIGKEKLFSSEECALLRELCKEVISKPPISIERIERALKESKEGVALLDRFSSKQIQNRLKYERRTLLR